MTNILEILQKGEGWVTYTYPDSSVKLFRTTLNKAFLDALKVEYRSDAFYDLDRQEFVPLVRGITLDVYKDRPSLGRMVDEFANRFI